MESSEPDHRPSIWEYYDRRVAQGVPGLANAVAYWSGLGVDATAEEIAAEGRQVEMTLRSLDAKTFVDVGAGPGTFTPMMPGWGAALDQSQKALEMLRLHNPQIPVVRADARRLPMRDRAADCVLAAHIYGLLHSDEREAIIAEARRVARRVVIIDAGRPSGVPDEHWQDRALPDGTQWRVFRRHFEPAALAEEVGGTVLFAGRFYVIVVIGH